MIRQMMIRIFRCIEPELNNLIALGDKVDSFNSLYMLVKMSHHVWTAQNVDPASFLSTTLGNVLVTVKRNFDKCIVSCKNQPKNKSCSVANSFNLGFDVRDLQSCEPERIAHWNREDTESGDSCCLSDPLGSS